MRSLSIRSAVAMVAVCFCAPGFSATLAPRQEMALEKDWRFHPGDVSADPAEARFDDRAWQTVTVPHTWNRLGERQIQRSSATNNEQGVGWYRLRFKAPESGEARRHFLQFDAVGNLAYVWLNGTKIGAHAGAFSRFRFDVTDALRPGEANVLVVKADNTKPAPGSSTQDLIPLGGDFFIHGGLYRGVSLITTDDVHIDLLDHGGPGVYAHATAISERLAQIAVLTRLRNAGGSARNVEVTTRVLDADGKEVATARERVQLARESTIEVRASLALPNPRLWNGRADPYRYTVKVEVRDGAAVLDAVAQPLGIRSFHVDANKGFFLNGKRMPLYGVSRHQDRAGKGWALTPADHEEDMALIAELGANTVRFAHYQHAQEWFELADRYGMIVWAEIPFVNAASFTSDEPTPALVANARQQLIELIRQNYNYASVITWSVGNEVDIGAAFERREAGRALGLLRNLHALAKQEDPTRPTVFADCCEASPMQPAGAELLAGATDLIGYNRYFGWYYGQPADLGAALDMFHERHPTIPLSVSEYGAGAALTQHSDDPTGGPINAFGRPHPEEYQSWYHEESWREISARPWVWASWIWNMFDFSSDLREEGDAVDLNDKGLVSYDRKVKKDAFYFYKAQWSDAPVVHITSSRYTERPYPVTDVRVYSNAPSVTLTHDGKDLGAATCENRVCVWRNVSLTAGANTLIASADFCGRAVTHSVTWNAPDAALGLSIDSGDLAGHRAADGRLVGSDNFFEGGEAKLLNVAGFGRNRNAPRRTVLGAQEPALHDSYREGRFSYEVPLPNGEWRVTLHAFEPDEAQARTRTFNVSANGRLQLRNFSPARAAGGALKAAEASFRVQVRDGRLQLAFEPAAGPALVSAITIAPVSDGE